MDPPQVKPTRGLEPRTPLLRGQISRTMRPASGRVSVRYGEPYRSKRVSARSLRARLWATGLGV
jgi:hypothetical protein